MVRQRHSQMAPSCHPTQAGVAPVSTEAEAAGQVHPEETVTAPEAAMVAMDQQVIWPGVLDRRTPTLGACQSGSSRTEERRPWSYTAHVSVRTNVLG